MTPDEVEREVQAGQTRPVYLILGEDAYIQSSVIETLKKAALEPGAMGLNEDFLSAAEADCGQVLSIARTLPMFARRRLVVVRNLEKWEQRDATHTKSAGALDRLADYAADPSPSTLLVLAAAKLNKSRRLVKHAQKQDYFISSEPLPPRELPGWIERRAKALEVRLGPGVAALLAELCGPELSAVADSLERLALYVGAGGEITEHAVAECIVRVRPTTVWELVDAVAQRNLGAALSALDQVYDPHDRGLRLVGVLGWLARQLAKFDAALAQGMTPPDAAKAAGAPPFKARDLTAQLKRITRADLANWLKTLRDVDQDLKGGSKLPPKAVLQRAVIDLCQAGRGRARA